MLRRFSTSTLRVSSVTKRSRIPMEDWSNSTKCFWADSAYACNQKK